MTTLLDEKINACREAIQKAMERAEGIQKMQKRLNEEIETDHLMFDDPFICEREMDYQLDK